MKDLLPEVIAPPPNPNGDVRKKRADAGKVHRPKSIFSRGLVATLRRNGANVKELRVIERGLREMLCPEGPLAELFFDKFWACVLRLMLCGQLEGLPAAAESDVSSSHRLPQLRRGFEPMLSQFDDANVNRSSPTTSDTDLLHRLSLIARYDRAASRELYRCLSLLLVLRDQGEAGLSDWAVATAGIKGGE